MRRDMKNITRTGLAMLGLSLVFGMGENGFSQSSSKDIEVIPNNQLAGVQVNLNIDKPTVKVGEQVQLCFTANQPGFVTLWDVGTSGKVAKIWPTSTGESGQVQPNVKVCAGSPQNNYFFKISGPAGMEDVFALWTRNKDDQPVNGNFVSAKGIAKDILVQPKENWVTAKATFEISDGTSSTMTVTPPAGNRFSYTQGNVYILAMGANVGGLTKPNQDARNFAATMKGLLNVSANNVQVIENVYARDFKNAMMELKNKAKSNDLILLFFSGHGSTIKDDNGDEADGLDEIFITMDVEGKVSMDDNDVVRDDQFSQWVNDLPTDKVITVIDACHSGGMQKDFTMTNSRVKFFSKGNLGTAAPKSTISMAKNLGSLMRKDMAGGMDDTRVGPSSLKGLVLAAAQEDQYALELQDGGLFINSLVLELQATPLQDLWKSFAQAQQRVVEKSKGKQKPTSVGQEDLARILQPSR